MGDMPRWNKLLQEIREQQDKPDKGDKVAFVNNLTPKKRSRKGEENE